MKKTTLLIIGAFAFVLQSATAQPYTLYSEGFEESNIGDTPLNMMGGQMYGGIGGGASTFTVVNKAHVDPFDTQSADLNVTTAATGWGNGFWSGDSLTYIPGDGNALADMTFSIDLAATGTSVPVPTIWFVQKNGLGNQVWAASYVPVITQDAVWNHVSFTLDELTIQTIQQNSANTDPFDGQRAFTITVTGGLLDGVGTGDLWQDNLLLVAANPIPEPGTIALLTLGGLGALVAIRRRRA